MSAIQYMVGVDPVRVVYEELVESLPKRPRSWLMMLQRFIVEQWWPDRHMIQVICVNCTLLWKLDNIVDISSVMYSILTLLLVVIRSMAQFTQTVNVDGGSGI